MPRLQGNAGGAIFKATVVVALMATLIVPCAAVAEDMKTAQIDVSVRLTSEGPAISNRVIVDALLRNRSASPIFFMQSSPEFNYQIEIVGPGGSPVELTTFARCVLPYLTLISNIPRRLEPGEENHVESVELNRLFRFDRIGRHRIVVRRRLWRINSRFPSLTLEDWFFCHPQVCADQVAASSTPYSFVITSAQPDSSPKADPSECR
jgi:hypothetical protein